ncbi:MAG: DUF4390 domain-containing protein [Desulfomicrobium sp.]|nr:DUF4390 domain-containing protein [Desulfomicrobium sp.]
MSSKREKINKIMPQRRTALIFILVIPMMLFFCRGALAHVVGVTGLGVSNSEGEVCVGFGLVVQDESAVVEALNDGGEYEVVCTGKLYNRRVGIWNEFLAEASYVCTLTSNPIAREFRVQDSRGSRIFEFSDVTSSLNLFWSSMSLSMGSWDMIERNRVYKVVLNFKISRTNVSGWVNKPLFFSGWDLVPEQSYEFEFDY